MSDCCKGETVKKAEIFSSEDINNFLKIDPNNTNKYLLVRKAVCIAAVAGGVRGSNLRPMTQSSIEEVPNGLKLTFEPCKLGGHLEERE